MRHELPFLVSLHHSMFPCASQLAYYEKETWAAKAWADSDAGKISIDEVRNKENVTEALTVEETTTASDKIGDLLSGSEGARNFASLDNYMMSQLNPLASEIIKACLPNGSFPGVCKFA